MYFKISFLTIILDTQGQTNIKRYNGKHNQIFYIMIFLLLCKRLLLYRWLWKRFNLKVNRFLFNFIFCIIFQNNMVFIFFIIFFSYYFLFSNDFSFCFKALNFVSLRAFVFKIHVFYKEAYHSKEKSRKDAVKQSGNILKCNASSDLHLSTTILSYEVNINIWFFFTFLSIML